MQLTYDLHTVMPMFSRKEISTTGDDRRRSPRIFCGGLANIVSLPSEGLARPGRLLDLSLQGCGLETEFTLTNGMLAEILLRVNSSSFRVLCQVTANTAPHHVGVEFLRLSGFGQSILEELMRELARRRAVSRTIQMVRRRPDSVAQEALSISRSLRLERNPIPVMPAEKREVRRERSSTSLVVNELDLFI